VLLSRTLSASHGGLPALRGDEQAAILIHLDAAAVPTVPTVPGGSAEPTGQALDVARLAEFLTSAQLPDSPPEHANGANTGGGVGSAEPPRPRPYARIDRGPGLPERVIKRLLSTGRIRTVIYDPAPARRALGQRSPAHRRR
jgi:hypothetical protein